MKKNSFLLQNILVVCFYLLAGIANGQSESAKELKKKQQKLKQDISYTQQVLGSTKKNKLVSMGQLFTINKQIGTRTELIATINAEIGRLDQQIHQTNTEIVSQQRELDKLKSEYAQMIYYAYKTQNSYNRLMFVFAAADFDQAFMRLRYLQQYSEYRKKQAKMIVIAKQQLGQKVLRLHGQKEVKGVLLTSEEKEKQELFTAKKEKEQVVSQLQQKESDLKKELKNKQRDEKKFQQAIERVIADELAKAAKEIERKNKAAGETKKAPVVLTKIPLTSETQKLSTTFALNRGKLPWPVEKGFIVGQFGVHPHPVMKNIDINNNGIDIKTEEGVPARSVFEGEVKAIVNMPGSGKFILIRHGEYLTIYSNLKDIYVQVGSKVQAKQKIGSIIHDEKGEGSILHFELWKGTVKTNPEMWIFTSQ